MRKLTHSEIVDRQRARARQPRLPLTVVLDDIRSLHNVGAIFRTADGAGVEGLWLCGITGCPPQSGLAKTALGAETAVPWQYAPAVAPVVRALKEQGYTVLLLEQAAGSVAAGDFRPAGPVCLVVGNEIDGVNEELLPLADACLEIPMCGVKNSLNVAVAFGVAAYALRARWPAAESRG